MQQNNKEPTSTAVSTPDHSPGQLDSAPSLDFGSSSALNTSNEPFFQSPSSAIFPASPIGAEVGKRQDYKGDDDEDVTARQIDMPNDADGDEAPPLCAKSFLVPLTIAFSGSIVLGLVIAFTPFYLIVNELDSDCSMLEGQPACESTNANCIWLAQNATCVFPNYKTVACPAIASSDECKQLNGCVYSFFAEECKVANGWTPAQIGIFGGFATLGAIATPTAFPPIYERIGARKTMILFSVLILIGTAITNIGHATRSFSVLIVARVTLGASFGIGMVVAGAYPYEMIHPSKQQFVGSFINFAIPWSIFLGVALGLILEPTDLKSADLNIDARVHGWLTIYYVAGLFFLFISFIMDESRAYVASCDKKRESAAKKQGEKYAVGDDEEMRRQQQSPGSDCSSGSDLVDEHDGNTKDSESLLSFACNNARALVAVICIFALQQMTGINSISIYMPTIAKQLLGIRPLVGALVFNLYGGLLQPSGPYLASKGYNPITIMVVGGVLLCFALVVAGVAAIPGLIEDTTSQGIAVGVAFLGFVTAFQPFVGPTAFDLTLRLFKPSDAPRSMAFASTWLNIWAFLCVLTFPLFVEVISGGPDKDQNKGLAGTLLIFAGIALLSAVLIKFFSKINTKN